MTVATPTAADPLQAILTGLRFNNVRIPSLPSAAIRVRTAASQPDISVDALALEIGRDAALAARLIRVANSPLVRARSEIRSLPQAIMRMGIDYIRDLVTTFALESSFQPRSPTVARILRDVWNRSKQVAAVSAALARYTGMQSADQALLAGLIHSIGALPLLVEADQRDDLAEFPNQLLALIDETHAELGSAILEAWHFPRELAEVPRLYRDPDRGDGDDAAELADVVALAALIVNCVHLPPEQRPLWNQLASVQRLSLADDVAVLESFHTREDTIRTRQLLS